MRAAEARIYLLLLLLLGGFIRFWFSDFKPVILDFDPFYHARIAETIYSEGRIPKWDPLELGGIPHYYPPGYHLLMVAGKYAVPGMDFIELGSVLTVFFGLFAGLLFYRMAAPELGRGLALMAGALYIFTPAVVLRSGLVARPTGLSILLTIFVLYALLRILRRDDFKNRLVFFLALLGYTLSHGSVVAVFVLVLITVLLLKESRKQVLIITTLSIGAGLAYYYSVLGALNFSMGFTTETQPLFSIKDLFFPKEPLSLLITLSIYGLVFLPLVFHGAYVFYTKSRKTLLLLTLFSLATAFFKLSIFLLFIFALFTAMAGSLGSIQNLRWGKIKVGWSIAAFVLVAILMTNALLLYNLKGVKVNSNVEPLREFLSGVDFQGGAVILSNDVNPGHEIAYYFTASVFMSDLTDVKRWDENYEVYKALFDENLSADKAIGILKANKINYLLIVHSSKKFPFLEKIGLEVIKENESFSLYSLK